MAKRYITLLVRETTDSPWCIHFGDYSMFTVRDERRDIVDAGDYAWRNTRIIETSDQQAAIDARVNRLNATGA